MHTEVQVALKFVISFLYNKLPRRRVNLFGEELDNALKDKFQGHWYPDQPFKGSAYRCLKITDPSDPVLNRAARESGNPLPDIIENMPADLAVWIDPGEVSYRMGEKGSVKILYSEKDSSLNMEDINPEVRGFLSLESVTASLNSLSLSQNTYSSGMVAGGVTGGSSTGSMSGAVSPSLMNSPAAVGVPTTPGAGMLNYPHHPLPHHQQNPYQARQPPVVYTAASFAQTKFGSTKLKTNSKKPNRMSPTEFSNYIKQRALQKSVQQQQQQNGQFGAPSPTGHHSPVSPGGNGYSDRYGNNQMANGYFSYGNSNSNYNNQSGSQNNYQKFFNNMQQQQVNCNNSNDFLWSGNTSNSRSSSVGSHLSPGGSNITSGLAGTGSMGNQNNLSQSPVTVQQNNCLNLSDYSGLFTDWDNELETNAFLQDILASATGGSGNSSNNGGQKSGKLGGGSGVSCGSSAGGIIGSGSGQGSHGGLVGISGGLDDWFNGGSGVGGSQTANQIGFNSNQEIRYSKFLSLTFLLTFFINFIFSTTLVFIRIRL